MPGGGPRWCGSRSRSVASKTETPAQPRPPPRKSPPSIFNFYLRKRRRGRARAANGIAPPGDLLLFFFAEVRRSFFHSPFPQSQPTPAPQTPGLAPARARQHRPPPL